MLTITRTVENMKLADIIVVRLADRVIRRQLGIARHVVIAPNILTAHGASRSIPLPLVGAWKMVRYQRFPCDLHLLKVGTQFVKVTHGRSTVYSNTSPPRQSAPV